MTKDLTQCGNSHDLIDMRSENSWEKEMRGTIPVQS